MPHRFQLFERIVFSLVVLSAVMCSTFITYERCPELKIAFQREAEILAQSEGYAFDCTSVADAPCTQQLLVH